MQNKPIGILEFQREVNLPVFSLQEIIDFQLVADTLVDSTPERFSPGLGDEEMKKRKKIP